MKRENLYVSGARKKNLVLLLNFMKRNVLRNRFAVLFVTKISKKLRKASIEKNACSDK